MRPDKPTYFMMITDIVAKRSTCFRRQVGCVLVDFDGNIKATGYNGVVSGMPHCEYCYRELSPSGSDLWECPVIHAEINALSRYEGSRKDICAIYCTTLPCFHCAKVIANALPNLKELHYHDDYPHSDKIKDVFLHKTIKLLRHTSEGIVEVLTSKDGE